MISKDAIMINRFMGMMANWISEERTAYFKVRFSTYELGENHDIEVVNTREGFYTGGFTYVRKS